VPSISNMLGTATPDRSSARVSSSFCSPSACTTIVYTTRNDGQYLDGTHSVITLITHPYCLRTMVRGNV
jgi:hypothetical protein